MQHRSKNRWLIALATIAIHLSIGSVYAYSVFKAPLTEQLGWDSSKVALAFTIAIFFLGITAAFCGKWIEAWGPRISGIAAAVLFCGGLALAGLGVQVQSLAVFYLGYGVIGGIGLGVGYLAPVSTLVAWFPDRRGLATGMAVMGFGAGALAAGPVAASLIDAIGLAQTFAMMSAGYLVLMLAGALYITRPGQNDPSMHNAKSERTPQDNRTAANVQDVLPVETTPREALRSARFWLLWMMFFINITSGIMLISIASPMAQEQTGLSVAGAATMVGLMGLFNGCGRIGWSTLSDYWGRPNLFTMFFALQLVLCPLLPQLTVPLLFQLSTFLIVSFYGGGFALVPAFISDLFGTRHLGVILGYLLTAWSAAGIAGPLLVAYIRDQTGSYHLAFYLVTVLIALALVASLLIRRYAAAEGAGQQGTLGRQSH